MRRKRPASANAPNDRPLVSPPALSYARVPESKRKITRSQDRNRRRLKTALVVASSAWVGALATDEAARYSSQAALNRQAKRFVDAIRPVMTIAGTQKESRELYDPMTDPTLDPRLRNAYIREKERLGKLTRLDAKIASNRTKIMMVGAGIGGGAGFLAMRRRKK
jgi:hypothetical protein